MRVSWLQLGLGIGTIITAGLANYYAVTGEIDTQLRLQQQQLNRVEEGMIANAQLLQARNLVDTLPLLLNEIKQTQLLITKQLRQVDRRLLRLELNAGITDNLNDE